MSAPSYHDLHITTAGIPRTSIFNLPYNYEVRLARASGWTLWDWFDPKNPVQIAGEYGAEGTGLRLDVAGHVIVDSLTEKASDNVDQVRNPA